MTDRALRTKSQEAYAEAVRYMPGGVNSPVRAFKAVGGTPVFVARGEGSRITDIDGNSYIDYVMSWGPLIHGHAFPKIAVAVTKALRRGASFGAPTLAETALAREVTELVPSIEKVRFVSSGTEAVQSAVRLARGFTGRDVVIKFDGCYHGHVDSLLVKAGSGAATFGEPSSPGVPRALAELTLVVPYNDLDALKVVMTARGGEVAAVVVEPVAGNMGVVAPAEGFLGGLRELTADCGALLVFDEVITGFRVARGGAQALYGVTPDLTTLGKILGGGLPVGAYGGRADVMAHVLPEGPVNQAGTLSGNPLAMAAGLAALEALEREDFYTELEARAAALGEGLAAAADEAGVPAVLARVGSMMTLHLGAEKVENLEDVASTDDELFKRWFWGMLERGVWLAPSKYEAMFVSAAHTDADIDATLGAAREVLTELAG
jgi:glutamate-1-semialdehyde 2,1-aminomutase